jgi:hypothetical protein
MKNKITLSLLFLILCTLAYAQAPNSFKYQAVARDAGNQPYVNTNLGVRISLVRDNATGTIDYSESHTIITSNLGVFDIQIGGGTPLSGDFSMIDWGANAYFLKVDIDPAGGTNYINMGTSQLLSVPYAIYANEAGNGSGGSDDQTLSISGTNLSIEDGNTVDLSAIQDGVNDADSDPTNEIQTLSFDAGSNEISISGGNSITIPTGGTDADADPTNELQNLSFSGTSLSIDNGNSVDLATLQDGTEDADADPMNEIQSLSLSGSTLSLSNGGGNVNLPTSSDDQNLTFSGTTLSIEDGNTVDLATLQDGTEDADADPTNEIQTISKSGNTVTLSNGGGSFTDDVNDADDNPTNELQDLSLSGSNLQISGGNSVNLAALADSPWNEAGNDIYYGLGDVAIGTSSPLQKLHVKVSGTDGMLIQGDNTGNAFYALSNGGGTHFLFDDMADANALGLQSANAMKFYTGGANERMRILSNGFIGVGTISPEFRFHVNGEFFVNSSAGRINFGSPGTGNRWRFSTQGSGANLQIQSKPSGSNTFTRRMYFTQDGHVGIGNNSNPDEELVVGSNLGSGWVIPAITVGGNSGGVVQAGNTDYKISMENSSTFGRARIVVTSPTGFGRGEAEMRTNGLTIGENAGSPGSYMLKVEHSSFGVNFARAGTDNDWEFLTSSAAASNLNLYANGAFRGNFSGTDGSYNTASDRRLKTNITELETVLPNLMQLKPSRYEYIANNPDKKQSIGFVAQEVEPLFPELVVKVEDERSKGTLAVKYGTFGVLAVKAIQEQQEVIEAQAQEIDELKKRLEKIEALLNK